MSEARSTYSRVGYFIGYFLRFLGGTLLFFGRGFGAALAIGGVLIMFGALRFFGLVIPLVAALVLSLLCVCAALIGSSFNRIGKKLTTRRAEDLLREDPRNPVLYLRSFVDDPIAAKIVPGDPQTEAISKSFAQFFITDSEEEVLAKELSRIGPCVAVGIPGERLPPVGVSRLYFRDDEWEQGVLTLMKRAELVVMRAGNTKGFSLELEMAVSHLDPTRLIIILPVEEEAADDINRLFEIKVEPPKEESFTDKHIEFRKLANRVLPKELPLFTSSPMPGSSLWGLIHFQSDWTPQILKLSDVGSTLKESFENISKRYSNYREI